MREKYGVSDSENIGRRLAEKPEDPREYASSMLFLPQEDAAFGKKKVYSDAFALPGAHIDSHIECKRYELRINADELESYMRRHETSRSSIFILFMNRVIAACHDLKGKPIAAAVAVDARSAYGAQETMQCCVGTVPVWYDDVLARCPISEQLKHTRQMLWDGAKPENIRASAWAIRRFNQTLEENFPGLEEKRAFCRQRNEQAGSMYTYGISYLGEADLGKGVNPYVTDMHIMVCANTVPVIIEIVKYGREYLVSYCTHLENDPYVARFREMFVSQGISCTCEQKANFVETLASF